MTIEPTFEIMIHNLETLKVFFDPLRMRIVRLLAERPLTVSEIAAQLAIPFTRLYYHMHLLEQHGLIRLIETRHLQGTIEEKVYRATAYFFVIDRALLKTGSPDEGYAALETTLNMALVGARDQILDAVGAGVIDMDHTPPAPRTLFCRRASYRLNPAQAVDFYQRLQALMLEYTTPDEEEKGDQIEDYGLAVALYPLRRDYSDSEKTND